MNAAAEQELLAHLPTGLFIGGRWGKATADHEFAVLDPSTGTRLANVSDASPEDGLRALDAAVLAFDDWSGRSARERSMMLRSVFDLIERDRERLALLITLEMGKPLAEAHGEITYGAEFLRWFAEEAVRVSGRFGTEPGGSGTMVVSHRAVGPSLLITPWNFPLAMATRKIAPALAAGCTVIVKPAELTPLTTLYIAGLFEEAGLPPGVLNVVPTTTAADVVGPLLDDPRLRKLSFTGSTPVGRTLIAQSARHILRTSMELGANAPFLVFDDADLDRAVEGAMLAKFRNGGQACTAANRFIVQRGIAPEFARRLGERVAALKLGRGTEPGVSLGPLIDARSVEKVNSLVSDAVDRGATVKAGGSRSSLGGCFFEPTILTNVPAGARVLREEIFGPVVAILEFDDEAEAISLANDTEYGLVSYVFTCDISRAQRLEDRLETGMMGLNSGLVSNAAAPFGGVKQSGLGREGGPEGIHEYLTTKYSFSPHM